VFTLITSLTVSLFTLKVIGISSIYMKLFENGYLVYVDVTSRDVIRTNIRMTPQETKTVKGVPIPKSEWKAANITARNTRTTFADEGQDHLLWLYSQKGLAVLNLETLEHEVIEMFWRKGERDHIGTIAISDKMYSKFCGVGLGHSDKQFIFFKTKIMKSSSFLDVQTDLESMFEVLTH